MCTIKMLHILFVIIWTGTLLTLSRLLGYHTKYSETTQLETAKIYHRIYKFIDVPAMILSIVFGIVLLLNKDFGGKQGWFHMKLTFVALLVIADIAVGKFIGDLVGKVDTSRGVKYKIVHGLCGLFLIGILVSIYIVKVNCQ